ncbi:unnamed protein product [Gordionus sp. m RMFG-2023]|uniref:large ribosomal subunit protein P1-like n=1 Tax=Gordionus sp. m RMFG-2023 TaxID=3053472 RepID=UPI0030E4641A
MSDPELACIYSALILSDDNVAITADKISTILKAAKVEIEPFWQVLYAKALNNVDVKDLITNLSSGVSAGPAPTSAVDSAPAPTEAKPDEKKSKKEEKKEESEESDADMGFGLFD